MSIFGEVDDAFKPARETIEWANEAIVEFDDIARRFFQNDSAEFVTEFDPKTGENVFKVRIIKQIPSILRRKATEALVNTKHAFDQSTFAGRSLTGGTRSKRVNFPWAENPVDLETLLDKGQIDKRLWEVFFAQQPYPTGNGYSGGNHIVRSLARIANKKHNVGLAIDMIPHTFCTEGNEVSGTSLSIMVPRWDPIKQEAELSRFRGVATYHNPDVIFDISLKDPSLPGGLGAVRTLRVFLAAAVRFTENLSARCKDI